MFFFNTCHLCLSRILNPFEAVFIKILPMLNYLAWVPYESNTRSYNYNYYQLFTTIFIGIGLQSLFISKLLLQHF